MVITSDKYQVKHLFSCIVYTPDGGAITAASPADAQRIAWELNRAHAPECPLQVDGITQWTYCKRDGCDTWYALVADRDPLRVVYVSKCGDDCVVFEGDLSEIQNA